MAVVKYNPLNTLNKLERELSSLWPSNWDFPAVFSDSLVLDLYQENSTLVAELNLSNFKKDEIKVTTDEGFLEISAEHKDTTEKPPNRHYYYRENTERVFRRVNLPDGVISDEAKATFRDGKLVIKMPVIAPSQPQEIEIS